MKVTVLPVRFELTLLPADVKIAPGVIAPVLKPGGRVRLNCKLATEDVPGLKVTGRVTEAPACPEALPTVKVGAASTETAPNEQRRVNPTCSHFRVFMSLE
ncbi:MAG: hypothetical protein A2X40_12435 [Elusimicrobia bacterium GWC2_65_9]|nr:MAG: hypothetical protein A2X37_06080 [Elusimicrobia bacterium GWA2_66_18]OGR68559.1 MAG: hypothetical protein A2X40_12435 [Elusimicrobia bacterium GWC2_65_9]